MFRFTIRDVLWLVTLVAVLTAWWLDHGRLVRGMQTAWAIVMDDRLRSTPPSEKRLERYLELMKEFKTELRLPPPEKTAILHQP